MQLQRPPHPALARWVRCVWATQAESSPTPRELVLPNGETHVVFRLTEAPIRLFHGPDDTVGRTFGGAVVGGARSSAWLRDTSVPGVAVGLQLRPGGAAALLGLPASELAGRHVALEDVWGTRARSIRDELASERTLAARLDRLEASLRARLPGLDGVHPAVEHALARLGAGPTRLVGEVRRETGYSHRHFVALFRRDVGLGPKTWCRIARFQAALQRLSGGRVTGLAGIALDSGYADQAHLSREFRLIAGLSPREYRPSSPDRPSHVPWGDRVVNFLQDVPRIPR